jgi:hypothetical protein
MNWLDPSDPAVRSAVVSGAWGRAPHAPHGHLPPTEPTIDTIAAALDVASDILTRLTAFAVHPALDVVEDFIATPTAHRLYPTFSPLRSVVSVSRAAASGLTSVTNPGWSVFGDAIHFDEDCVLSYEEWFRWWCGCAPRARDYLRVAYTAGSTITASARAAIIALAHDIWLDSAGCTECGLPERTTAVTREGLSYTVGDPGDLLTGAMTGLPSVDLWIRGCNPAKALRPPGVWTPDSPPSVVYSVHVARPVFGSNVHLSSGATINVAAGTGT